MTEKIIIAGSGGQGIMLLGKVLAEAAMDGGKFVTWLPAYGAEVRGGTAHCMLVISDNEIGSPYVDKADILIIMNNLSYEKFRLRVNKNGRVIVNSSLVSLGKNKQIKQAPFTDIALKLGNVKVANMVVLGSYLKFSKTLQEKNVLRAIRKMAPADKKGLIKINEKALQAGRAL
jgi:2-oxoglutarate ferredoxin oxidoreductase subunit gamma